MNTQELQNSIEKMEAELQDMKRQLEAKQFEMMGGDYYVSSSGDALFGQTDTDAQNFGLERPTLKQARELLDWLKPLLIIRNFADQHNGDWKPDWSDFDQEKFYVRFNHVSNNWTKCKGVRLESKEQIYMPEHVADDLCAKLNNGEIEL